MTAIIGSGKEVDNVDILAYEYNLKTHMIILLLKNSSKRSIDTKIEKVVISDNGFMIDIFNGGKQK